jgi:hypothetical protein
MTGTLAVQDVMTQRWLHSSTVGSWWCHYASSTAAGGWLADSARSWALHNQLMMRKAIDMGLKGLKTSKTRH